MLGNLEELRNKLALQTLLLDYVESSLKTKLRVLLNNGRICEISHFVYDDDTRGFFATDDHSECWEIDGRSISSLSKNIVKVLNLESVEFEVWWQKTYANKLGQKIIEESFKEVALAAVKAFAPNL